MARTNLTHPHSFNQSTAEFRVWKALEAGLTERMIVLHSVSWLGDRRGEGEADFLIIDPDAGVLVIEVKGGSIACDRGAWYQCLKGRKFRKRIWPHRQARKSTHALRTRLDREVGAGGVLFGHLAWFPDVDTRDVQLPDDSPRDLTLDRRHLDAPEAAIAAAFAYWRAEYSWKDGGGEAMAQAIWNRLAPSFSCPAEDTSEVSLVAPIVPLSPAPAPATSVLVPARRRLREAASWSAEVLLAVGNAVMLAPVKFVLDVLNAILVVTRDLGGWLWGKIKGALEVAYVCCMMVCVAALILRFGFQKVEATHFIYGGLIGSFVGFAGTKIGASLEPGAKAAIDRAFAGWNAYRRVF